MDKLSKKEIEGNIASGYGEKVSGFEVLADSPVPDSPLRPPPIFRDDVFENDDSPFKDYHITYVSEISKILRKSTNELDNLLREDFFYILLKKDNKQTQKLRKILDTLQTYLFEFQRLRSVCEMENKLLNNEINLFRTHLTKREEMIMMLLCREQNLERKINEKEREIATYSQNLVHVKIKNKRSKISLRMTNYGDILEDHELLEWFVEEDKLKNVEIENEDLQNHWKYMKTAIDQKLNFLEETRSAFEKRLELKEVHLKELRKKLSKRSILSKREIQECEGKIKVLEKEISLIKKEKDTKLSEVNKAISNLQSKYDKVLNQLVEQRELLQKYEDIRLQYSDENYPKDKVTFVFTDIQNSSALWETSMDGMVTTLRIHNECIRRIMPKYKGYEVKTEGDAFMVAFKSSFDAINFCVVAQNELMDCNWPDFVYNHSEGSEEYDRNGNLIWKGLRVRMGVHCGSKPALIYEIDPVTHRCDYFGPPVNRAARVQGVACGGEICVSFEVWEEIKLIFKKLDVPSVVIKLGKFLLKGMEEKPEVIRAIFPTALVGRRGHLEARKIQPIKVVNKNKNASAMRKIKSQTASLDVQFSQGSIYDCSEIVELEKHEKLKYQSEMFCKLVSQRVVTQKRIFSETLRKMERIWKNPASMTLHPDFVREEKKFNCSTIRNVQEDIKRFTKFLEIGEPLEESKQNEIYEEYKILRKENLKSRKRKDSTKARYMDCFTTASERIKKIHEKRNRRSTESIFSPEKNGKFYTEEKSKLEAQTAIPSRSVKESIFDVKQGRNSNSNRKHQSSYSTNQSNENENSNHDVDDLGLFSGEIYKASTMTDLDSIKGLEKKLDAKLSIQPASSSMDEIKTNFLPQLSGKRNIFQNNNNNNNGNPENENMNKNVIIKIPEVEKPEITFPPIINPKKDSKKNIWGSDNSSNSSIVSSLESSVKSIRSTPNKSSRKKQLSRSRKSSKKIRIKKRRLMKSNSTRTSINNSISISSNQVNAKENFPNIRGRNKSRGISVDASKKVNVKTIGFGTL